MRSILCSAIPVALCVLPVMVRSSGVAQEPANPAPQAQARPEATADRYKVPEGGVEELLKFLTSLQPRNFNPTTADEILEYRRLAPPAMRAAAEKILELEKDARSPAARAARSTLFSFKVAKLPESSHEQQAELFDELHEYLISLEEMSRDELSLAFTTASILEQTGNAPLAITAYQKFGELFEKQKDELLSSYGEKMLGVARRVDLLGNEMTITGTTIDGEAFDWSQYRGKVVLVDFWATWCGPCIAELPNVLKNYEQYHERGFDVVGISLDTDREKLETFLKQRDLPWVTLFQDGAGWEHPVATYYGVMAIPTVILVDREGKVVSLNARGPELGQHLGNLFGPLPNGSGQ
jgi:thiol-disulfide isomerase/thioredoxin